jgi:hypothetical protein
MTPEPTADQVDHRQLGVDLFNHVWALLEREERTKADDDEMLHAAHASRYHWGLVGAPENLARGEWQCSRVYVAFGRGEPAVHHAQRCQELCEDNEIGDWDLAFAYEALARAHRVAGDGEEAAKYKRLARKAGDAIADAEDRQIFDSDYATL